MRIKYLLSVITVFAFVLMTNACSYLHEKRDSVSKPVRLNIVGNSEQGRALYVTGNPLILVCAVCHGSDGNGVPGKGGSLRRSSFTDNNYDYLLRLLLEDGFRTQNRLDNLIKFNESRISVLRQLLDKAVPGSSQYNSLEQQIKELQTELVQKRDGIEKMAAIIKNLTKQDRENLARFISFDLLKLTVGVDPNSSLYRELTSTRNNSSTPSSSSRSSNRHLRDIFD